MPFPVTRRPRPSYGAPPSVENLPFTLFRDALVTRDPELVAAAMQAFEEQEADREIYEADPGPYPLPQAMAYQQWKTPVMTGGANRPQHGDPFAPTAALMQVRADLIAMERDLIRANNPDIYPIEHAAFDRRGSDAYAPVDTRPVLVRDAPAEGHPIYPYPGPDVAYDATGELETEGPYTQGVQLRLANVRAEQSRLLGWLMGDVRGRR